MINYFVFGVGLVLCLFAFIASTVLFARQQHPVVKIIVSALVVILMISIAFIFTVTAGYNLSYFLDIAIIYFILGFSSFVLYFVFFNKRS